MSVARFADLVARQPDNAMFRFSLAQALLRENRREEALPQLQACADQKADWMVVRILLGQSLVKLGRRAEARPWLEAALALAVEQSHEDPERELRAQLAELDRAG